MVIRPDCIPLCPRTGRRYVHPLQIYLQSKLNEHKIVHSTSLIPTVYPTAQQTVHVRLASFSGFRSYLQENIDIRRSPPQGSAMYFYIMYNIFYYIMVHFLQYKATNFLRCDLKSAKVSDYPIDASRPSKSGAPIDRKILVVSRLVLPRFPEHRDVLIIL